MPLFVGLAIEAEGLLPVRLVWNDGLGAAVAQPLAQCSAVIGSVGEQFLGWFGLLDEWLGGRTIVCLATAQQDGKKAAFSICDCVDFRRVSERMCKQVSVSLPFNGDSHDDGNDTYAGTA
jgi:hypothetical protein